MSQDDQGELHRGLKPRHLQLIALGGIIGSGYFLGTGAIVQANGPAAILAYLLGGLAVYTVMVCLGELAAHIPVAGSFVSYANTFIHPIWGCAVGWSYWATWVAYVPAEMLAAGMIMHVFVPSVGVIPWALLFGLIITAINLFEVGAFGETEFWLALIKILAIGMFVVMATLILLGLIGKEGSPGGRYLLGNGGLFPKGLWAVFPTMVIILVNFQGSEIIGIAAGESSDPSQSIPAAVKAVTHRIIALYVIPVLLLVSILPWGEAGLTESVFAAALNRHGFRWAAGLFSFVVLTAAVSCSNSGLYATSRAIFSLAREGMAPAWLGRVNAHGVPFNAILFSVAGCWIFVMAFGWYGAESLIYKLLLALSGFTGGVAWISICWSQLGFRQAMRDHGIQDSQLGFKAPAFPIFTRVSLVIQMLCLAAVMFHPELRLSVFIGIPMLIAPAAWYAAKSRREGIDLGSLRTAKVAQAVATVRSKISAP